MALLVTVYSRSLLSRSFITIPSLITALDSTPIFIGLVLGYADSFKPAKRDAPQGLSLEVHVPFEYAILALCSACASL